MESKPFAEVRWDDEDLRNALDLQGYSQTEKNIALLRGVTSSVLTARVMTFTMRIGNRYIK